MNFRILWNWWIEFHFVEFPNFVNFVQLVNFVNFRILWNWWILRVSWIPNSYFRGFGLFHNFVNFRTLWLCALIKRQFCKVLRYKIVKIETFCWKFSIKSKITIWANILVLVWKIGTIRISITSSSFINAFSTICTFPFRNRVTNYGWKKREVSLLSFFPLVETF